MTSPTVSGWHQLPEADRPERPPAVRWLLPWILVLETPFLPLRAYRRVQRDGIVWLGPMIYAAGSAAVLYLTYRGSIGAEQATWVWVIHPMLGLFTFPGLPWYGYAILLPADLVFALMVFAAVPIAARAALNVVIEIWTWVSAAFLVLGTVGLIVILAASSPIIVSMLAPAGLNNWLPYALVCLLCGYLVLALMSFSDVSIWRACWLVTLYSSLFPVWFVGVLLRGYSRLRHRIRPVASDAELAGVIMQPSIEFARIEVYRPLRGALLTQALLCMATIAGLRLLYAPGKDTGTADVFFAIVLLQHQLVLSYVAMWLATGSSVVASDLVPSMLATFDHKPYLYGYALAVLFILPILTAAAAHLTARRMFGVDGSYRALLAVLLSVRNATALVLALAIGFLVLADQAGQAHTASQADNLAGVFVVWAYVALLAWSIYLQVVAIRSVYRLASRRSVQIWLGSLVLFVPVAILGVLMTAAEELARPFRVGRIRRQLLKKRQAVLTESAQTENSDLTPLIATFADFLSDYAERSDTRRRARQAVDLLDPFREVFVRAPASALNLVISRANYFDDATSTAVAAAVATGIQAVPEQVIPSIRQLTCCDQSVEMLRRMAALPEPRRIAELASVYYAMLRQLRDDNLLKELERAYGVLVSWRDWPHGEELYLVYRALYALRKATTVVDIERAEDDLVKVLNVRETHSDGLDGLLKPLLDISQYLAYYGRADFDNKLPYLAAPLMILVDLARKVGERPSPPVDRAFTLVIPYLETIVLREFDNLRGRADLRLELRPQRTPFDTHVSLELIIRNQGNAVAEQLEVELTAPNRAGYAIVGPGDAIVRARNSEIKMLSPKREARVEFTIQPEEPGRLRLPFTIT